MTNFKNPSTSNLVAVASGAAAVAVIVLVAGFLVLPTKAEQEEDAKKRRLLIQFLDSSHISFSRTDVGFVCLNTDGVTSDYFVLSKDEQYRLFIHTNKKSIQIPFKHIVITDPSFLLIKSRDNYFYICQSDDDLKLVGHYLSNQSNQSHVLRSNGILPSWTELKLNYLNITKDWSQCYIVEKDQTSFRTRDDKMMTSENSVFIQTNEDEQIIQYPFNLITVDMELKPYLPHADVVIETREGPVLYICLDKRVRDFLFERLPKIAVGDVSVGGKSQRRRKTRRRGKKA